MVMGTGLLALAMVATEGPPGPPVGEITFQVRVVTLDGLGWRSDAYPRLRPVARRGTSTIWTADRALAESLSAAARASTIAPRVTTGGEAVVTARNTTYFVAHMERASDGPINGASRVAFVPEVGNVQDGFQVRVSGRKLDQGVLARVSIDDKHVDAIHTVAMTETVRKPADERNEAAARTPVEVGIDVLQAAFHPGSDRLSTSIGLIRCQVQVPIISAAQVEGEWLIPGDGILLVSLGAHTVADDKGMAIVRERVAIFEAGAPPSGPGPFADRNPAPFAPDLAMPSTPARSLPEAVDPDGQVVDLPPLPESVASADLDRIKPAPNQPSPQAPGVDPQLARTSFVPVEPETLPDPRGLIPADPSPVARFLEMNGLEDFNIAVSDDFRTIRMTVKDAPKAIDQICKAQCDDEGPDMAACCSWASTLARSVSGILAGLASDEPKFPPLPPVRYINEEIEYFAPGPEFPYANTQAATRRARMEAAGLIIPPPSGGREGVSEEMNLGVSLKAADGQSVGGINADISNALKVPGKTETVSLPLGGRLTLEIKATVIATSPAPIEPPR